MKFTLGERLGRVLIKARIWDISHHACTICLNPVSETREISIEGGRKFWTCTDINECAQWLDLEISLVNGEGSV